jgi:hypothetical protein
MASRESLLTIVTDHEHRIGFWAVQFPVIDVLCCRCKSSSVKMAAMCIQLVMRFDRTARTSLGWHTHFDTGKPSQ